MKPSQLRLLFCGTILLYLAGDLFVFTGPLRQWSRRRLPDSPQSIGKAKAQGIVATVKGHPVFLPQLERAAKERAWLAGKTFGSLTPAQRKQERLAALEELIDHQLLRAATKDSSGNLAIPEARINESIARLATRFGGADKMMQELAAEGIDSDKELRLRLGARLQQEQYIASQIPAATEEEANTWLAAHAKELERPGQIRARHIFLSTQERDAGEAKEALQKALDELLSKRQDFAALATSLSQDERSKAVGDDLGWMTKSRLPADFATPLFALELNKPGLVRTKLGWHLAEVTERKNAEPRNDKEAQAEALAALTAVKRRDGVAALRKSLREDNAAAIRVFSEMIPE
ncbi:peptidylprolyl isomerase [Luteolibacter sp. Populi]|uniref:peptidylprolyl isomerase n=1 Tax=Luteolibacter sp. Populi TaxID=3230487 RepID=UPI003465B968